MRRADGDALGRQVRRLRDHRPRPRRLGVVEDAEVDVRDRGAGAVGPLDDEHRRPELEVVALRDLVQLVAPAAGRDPDGRRDVGPPDAGAHAAHCGGGPQLGRATNSVGRTTSEGGAAVAHAGEQELGGRAAHREVVASDDGDGRLEEIGDRDVVAADEREVAAERDAAAPRRREALPSISWFPPAITAVGGSGRSSSARIAAAPCSTANDPSSTVYVGGRPRSANASSSPTRRSSAGRTAAAADQRDPPVAEVEQVERRQPSSRCDGRTGPG